MTRRSIFAAAVLASLVLLAAPASAKGIESAKFTGPGLPKGGLWIHGDHPQLGALGIITDPGEKSAQPFSGETGPAYRAVVTFDFAPGDSATVIVYPYAAGGPRTYTPPNQVVSGAYLQSGWYQSMPELTIFLKNNGFPVHAPSAVTANAGTTASTASSGSWPVWAWILIAIGIGGALLLVATRQRRRVLA
jgi:hypothetical protein